MSGTGVWWANLHAIASDEKFGLAGFHAVRTTGTDHDVCSVVVSEDAWEAIQGKVPPGRYRGLPSPDQTPALRGSLGEEQALAPPARVANLPVVGDLLLVQERDVPGFATEHREVRIKDLFLLEVRPLDTFEPRLVELILVDARAFYRTHGEITGRWNVPGPGPGGRDARWPVAKLSEILRVVCDRLPGSPKLVRCPDVEAALRQTPPHVECWGANPRQVLDRLLEAFGLTWSLDLAGTCSIYWRGEGGVGEHASGAPSGPNPQTYDPHAKKGAWEGAVLEDTYSRRLPPSVPDQVLVVGGPSIVTVAIDYLVPVVPVQTLDLNSGQPYTRWVEVDLGEIERLLGLEPPPEGQAAPNTFAQGELHGRPAFYDVSTGRFVDAVFDTSGGLVTLTPRQADRPQLGVTPAWLLNLPLSQHTDDASNFRAPSVGGIDLPSARHPSPPAAVLNRELVENLRRNLLRFWQVPRKFRHLLPIRDRAESHRNGQRMKPVLEVFNWTQKEVDVTRQVQDQEQAAREVLRREWQGITEQIAAINARLRQIEILGLDEIASYYSALLQGDFKTSQGQFRPTPAILARPNPGNSREAMGALSTLLARGPQATGEAAALLGADVAAGVIRTFTLDTWEVLTLLREPGQPGFDLDPQNPEMVRFLRDRDFSEATTEALMPFFLVGSAHRDEDTARVALARGDVSGKQVVDSALRWGKRFLKQYLGVAGAEDAADVQVTKLKAQRDALVKQAEALEAQFNPVGLYLVQIRDLEAQIRVEEAKTRTRAVELWAKLAGVKKKLEEERAKQRTEAQQRIVALQTVNLPRREVQARVADAGQGVFEIDEPAGWVSDLSQPLSQALLIPMPVRAIFGTFAEPSFPPSSQEEAEAENELNTFVRGAFESLAADPQLAAFASSTGHLLPQAAAAQVRMGFTSQDLSGTARIEQGAYRILAPELRLKVGLGGPTNFPELVRRARQLAEAAMGLPGFSGSEVIPGRGPQVLEAGTVTVEGPRALNPNGRISAVEWVPGDEGAGVDTKISFDSPSDPLPGVDHPAPLEDLFALRTFKFGLDPEDFE